MAAKESEAPRKQREDRLSSLPDDILIDILCHLPLHLTINTELLSRRWLGLWTKVTSIHIIRHNPEYLIEFNTFFDAIMTQITSPFISKFTLEFLHLVPKWYKEGYDYTWLRQICDRNVREIKVTTANQNARFPTHMDHSSNTRPSHPRVELPCFIFQTQSFVSIELDSTFGCLLPQSDYTINLPNLKNLSLIFHLGEHKLLKKLIEACPSLEELSLKCDGDGWGFELYLTYSHKNLRRLYFNYNLWRRVEVVIITPKLEYLGFHAPKLAMFSFDVNPIELREVNIDITCYEEELSSEESKILSKHYKAICGVTILTLDVFALSNVSTSFRNANRVTLNMKTSHNTPIVLALAKLCPVLDVLILQFLDMGSNDEKHCVPPKCGYTNVLRRAIKRIEIETYWKDHQNPTKSFLELVEHLLSKDVGLEHFRFTIVDDNDSEKGNSNRKIRAEEKLCKLLYQCPTVSLDSEVEFIGKFLKMSRKAGPKVWRANGKVTSFRCSPWNGFNF